MSEPRGRVPPNDLDAEAAVLSACLLDAGALDVVVPLLQPECFYAEANRRIYEAIVGLAEDSQPVDAVTVAAWLRSNDRLAQIGGTPYLAQITDATPSIANVEAHARIVVAKWKRRQMIATCQKIAASGYGDIADEAAWIDAAEQDVYNIAHTAEASDSVHVSDAVRADLAATTEAAQRGDRITGLATGFTRLDAMTAGQHDGDLTIVAARPGMGKAQPITAKVLTPSGWERMGNLRVGDMVIGADGRPTRVVGVFDRGRLPVYRITMADGASTECCDEHLWFTRTRSDRRRGLPGSVKPLSDIRETLQRSADGGSNHSIPYVAPVEFAPLDSPLPLDPYLLGVWIGDGHGGATSFVVSNPEKDIQAAIAKLVPEVDMAATGTDGLTVRVRRERRTGAPSGSMAALRSLGLERCNSESKFIPLAYLRATVAARVRLLQGLCDTDGYVTVGGKSIEYTTVSERLVEDLRELVGGLGGYVTVSEKLGAYTKNGKQHTTRVVYRMILAFPRGDIVPVASEKQLAKWNATPHRLPERYVKDVEMVGEKVCRCIKVESDQALYVTDGYIVTHNTSLVLNIAVNIARHGTPVHIFSLEMPREQLAGRMLCSEASVDLGKKRSGMLQHADWGKLTSAASELYRLPIWIDDKPAVSVLEVRAKVRRRSADLARIAAANPPGEGEKPKPTRIGLVVIDYLQLMSGSGETREQEVSGISRALKALAKELRVPVVVLSQLNRSVETRGIRDKRPQLSDLRESGAIEQDADNVIFIYRDDYYNRDSDKKGLAELMVAKQRNGPTGHVFVRWYAACARFDNLQPGEEPNETEAA